MLHVKKGVLKTRNTSSRAALCKSLNRIFRKVCAEATGAEDVVLLEFQGMRAIADPLEKGFFLYILDTLDSHFLLLSLQVLTISVEINASGIGKIRLTR